MLLREAGSVHLIASMPPFAAAPVSAGGSDVMMDRHRIIQRAFNMRPHMVSISLAWAQRPRCASTSTRIGRPGSSTGTTRANSTATLPHPRSRILRQVVVADTDEEALETTRAANGDWYHSITKLWHDRDEHSVDGLFAWETATQHETIIFGSPARVREQIDRLAKASGCSYVICAFAWGTLPHEGERGDARLGSAALATGRGMA